MPKAVFLIRRHIKLSGVTMVSNPRIRAEDTKIKQIGKRIKRIFLDLYDVTLF